ncbi:MAG TPA: hypothetical protein VJH92_00235 [Candidatus Nanoarchaeia archaeon]|nr:hypothetical protein [Candidatus Nanoarchaeia archaeon]
MIKGRYSTIELIIRDKIINIPSNEDSDKITIGDGIIYSSAFYRVQGVGVRTEPDSRRIRYLELLSPHEEVNYYAKEFWKSLNQPLPISVYNLGNLILEWGIVKTKLSPERKLF